MPCGLLKVTGHRKFNNSKIRSFVTLPVPTNINMKFLTRKEVRNLIMKL